MIPDDILRTFNDARVVVTGGTGLIGRQVVKILCDAGARVTSVSLDHLSVDDRASFVYGDLTSFDFCREIIKDARFVFHLAGIKGSMGVSKTHLASHFVPTVMMNVNVLEACRLNGVEKVVYTSSIGAYQSAEIFRESDYRIDTNPLDFAGWAKRMGELQVEAYRVQYGMKHFAVVRPANVYGPGDNFDAETAMVVPSLMARIRKGEDPLVVWGDGSAVRDFVYSRDVAGGTVLALYHGTGGGFVNLGGAGVTIRDLVGTLRQFISFRYEFDTAKPSGIPRRVMDISLARKTIGYDPSTSLRQGLEETWRWFVEHGQEFINKKNYFA